MRVRLELIEKVEVLNFISSGKKQIEAAKRFGIPRGTVSQIVKDEDKIMERFSQNRNVKSKAFMESPYSAIEEPLIQWINLARENKIPVFNALIQEKALEFAKEIGMCDFCASNGWLSRFKIRHNLGGKAMTGAADCKGRTWPITRGASGLLRGPRVTYCKGRVWPMTMCCLGSPSC